MSAVLSPCGLYRYQLGRQVQPEGKVFAFIGVNPSTADASIDDATVRKWRGFTQRNGGRCFIVGNLFAFRATDVEKLAREEDPHGPDNAVHLSSILTAADVVVPCWGSRQKIPKRLHGTLDLWAATLRALDKPVLCFGLTASGDPKHPLMLGYDTPLVPFAKEPGHG